MQDFIHQQYDVENLCFGLHYHAVSLAESPKKDDKGPKRFRDFLHSRQWPLPWVGSYIHPEERKNSRYEGFAELVRHLGGPRNSRDHKYIKGSPKGLCSGSHETGSCCGLWPVHLGCLGNW